MFNVNNCLGLKYCKYIKLNFYFREYGTIESSEQRARYKADFNAEYEEYLRLHAQIKSISRRFASLEHRLHTCEEGSEEHKVCLLVLTLDFSKII